MASSRVHVIVIGGSIADLTLAHCLDYAGVDYIVLEKHSNIGDTPLGGFIALMPNGAHILAQLGLYTALARSSKPITVAHSSYPDGFEFSDNWPSLMASRCAPLIRLSTKTFPLVTIVLLNRCGFPLSVLRRDDLLSTLYDALKDRSKVLLKRRVIAIQQCDSGVSAVTQDGNTYRGDIVVGADGVHSVTRSEIAKHAHLQETSFRSSPCISSCRLLHEATGFGAEYSSVVGISALIPGIHAGEQIVHYHDDLTIFLFGEGTSIGWIVVQKLERRHAYPCVPHFTKDDAIDTCKPILGVRIWRDVKFGDVWSLWRRDFCRIGTTAALSA